MIGLSLARLCEITGARPLRATAAAKTSRISFRGIECDMHAVRGGELFIALESSAQAVADAVMIAFERGAAGFLVPDRAADAVKIAEPERVVAIASVEAALRPLALHWRRTTAPEIVLICGPAGKTTTREILSSILLQSSRGGFSFGPLSTIVDLAIALLRFSADHRWAIIEFVPTEQNVEFLASLQPNSVVTTGALPAEEAVALAGLRSKLADSATAFIDGADRDAHAYEIKALGWWGSRFGLVCDSATDGEATGSACLRADAELNLPGKLPIDSALLAVRAARRLTSVTGVLPVAELARRLSAFRSASLRLNFKQTVTGQPALDLREDVRPSVLRWAFHTAAELAASGQSSAAILLGELPPESAGVLMDPEVPLPQIVISTLSEEEGRLAGGLSARLAANRQQWYRAGSVAELMHIVPPLGFGMLIVLGRFPFGLERFLLDLPEGIQREESDPDPQA